MARFGMVWQAWVQRVFTLFRKGFVMATATKRISTNGTSKATAADHLQQMEESVKQPKVTPTKPIVLPELQLGIIEVPIVGTSPLVVHRFGPKARLEILNKQMGKASAGREVKNPEQDFKESLYLLPDGRTGFPMIAFKCAAVTACTSLGKSITKVMARQAFHMVGEYAVLDSEPKMREDVVRLPTGGTDIRFRGEYFPWSTVLTVRFNRRVLTEDQIVNLINIAGFAVGVGEWRPEKDGLFGTFVVMKGESR